VTVAEILRAEPLGFPGGQDHALYADVVGAFEEVALLATTDSAGMKDVLRLVGRRLCELLNVSRCSVYLRREDGKFQGQVGYCVGRGHIDAGVSKLVSGGRHDLFTAEIVQTMAPVLVRDAPHDPRTVQRTMRLWGVRDMLGVPLVVDHEVIGIIYVDNQHKDHEYTDREVQLAQAFAGLSALAVRQGWLYRQLGERAKVIDEQRRVLGESAAIHSRVTRAVLDGATIEEILALIVELLGKPAVLYGPDLTVRSFALPGSLTQRGCPALTPAQAASAPVQQALRDLGDGRSVAMVRANPQWQCRRLLVRLLADRTCVGYLELCELGRSFSRVDSTALEQAGMAVSLKLLSAQHSAELYRQEREEYFADVLCGRRDAGKLRQHASSFGLDLTKRHLVLRVQYDNQTEGDAEIGNARRQAVQSLVTAELGASIPCVASTGVPGADLLLLEAPGHEGWLAASSPGGQLAAAFGQLAGRFAVRFAVVSEPCLPDDLPSASDRVREIAGLLQETSTTPRLVFSRDLELIRLIARRDGLAGAQRYAAELLSPLVEHDRANGAALVDTLHAFVGCQAQIRATAAQLSVHENTVRYRLSRIREISAIEPERLDALLAVAVALQVRSLCAGTGSAPADGVSVPAVVLHS
jgi:sugar diacid utilization regulator